MKIKGFLFPVFVFGVLFLVASSETSMEDKAAEALFEQEKNQAVDDEKFLGLGIHGIIGIGQGFGLGGGGYGGRYGLGGRRGGIGGGYGGYGRGYGGYGGYGRGYGGYGGYGRGPYGGGYGIGYGGIP